MIAARRTARVACTVCLFPYLMASAESAAGATTDAAMPPQGATGGTAAGATTNGGASPRAAAPGSGARDVPAQLREAGDRYDRAFKLYDEGAYEAALSELKRAYELAPTFRILYNLGVMSLSVHDPAGAMDYFERYLAEGEAAVPSDVRAQIGEELVELATRVGSVVVEVNVPGAQVSIDDRAIGAAPLGRALRLNAGSRRIAAHASGWLPDSMLLNLAGGDAQRVVLTLSDPRGALSSRARATPDRSVPWLGFGATALLATGAVFSAVEALSAQSAFDRKRSTLGVGAAELERADARAFRWSVTADALTAAALAAGGYSLYVWLAPTDTESDGVQANVERRDAVRVDLTASGVALSGRF